MNPQHRCGVADSRTQHDDAPRIIILSGPSGSGKTTIVQRLLREAPARVMKAVSATTRPPRQTEAHGQDYYFLNPEEFHARRQAGEFLECAEVHGVGHWYGTLKSELERASHNGAWALLEIDVEGAMNVLREYPAAVTVFLKTPSLEEYERRLRARGTESESAVHRRLDTARRELQAAGRYQYHVVNDDLDSAVREISRILAEEEAKRHA